MGNRTAGLGECLLKAEESPGPRGFLQGQVQSLVLSTCQRILFTEKVLILTPQSELECDVSFTKY
jgi:hypothetical protein